MNGDWVFHLDFVRFLERWRAATTGEISARAYDRARLAPALIRDFLLLVGVDAPVAAAIAEQTPTLNVGSGGRRGLGNRLADILLRARFARSNARLRRSWKVELARH
jgi:hypothetical protein